MDDAEAISRYSESEFTLLSETASEAGLDWSEPTVSRVDADGISAIVWGDPDEGTALFLHGGGQNAHTWDTVLLALTQRDPAFSAIAVDLPGHGRSEWRGDRDYTPVTNAAAISRFLRGRGVSVDSVIGMSLGGLTALALDGTLSERRRVLVDVTPSTAGRVAEMTKAQREATALVAGPRTFGSFDDVLEATVASSPTRSRSSLRRGILHNTLQLDDGTWQWRYDTLGAGESGPSMNADALWSVVDDSTVPTFLARGGESFFTPQDDVDEYVRRSPDTTFMVVAGAGHSVQGDKPIELARLIGDFVL